jgi:protein TonB
MAAAVVADNLVPQDQDEALQEAVDAAAVPAESIAPVENAEAPAPAVPDAAASVPEDVIATAMEDDRQPLAAVSDAPMIAADAPTKPLPDEAISAPADDTAPEPVVDAAIATADATAEPAVDDATAVADARREPIAVEDAVAMPVPDETRVAAIEPPEDVATAPPMPKPRPVAPKPKKKPAVQPRAESPRPAPRSQQQAGSIAEQAARGRSAGKAGADGRSTTERGKADVSGYRAKLAAHLRRFRTYPPEARSRGISGTVTVRFTVNARGVVTGAAVTASSGERVLDAAATAMVNRASPFPPIPANLGTKTMTVTAPVRFGLR